MRCRWDDHSKWCKGSIIFGIYCWIVIVVMGFKVTLSLYIVSKGFEGVIILIPINITDIFVCVSFLEWIKWQFIHLSILEMRLPVPKHGPGALQCHSHNHSIEAEIEIHWRHGTGILASCGSYSFGTKLIVFRNCTTLRCDKDEKGITNFDECRTHCKCKCYHHIW